MRAEDIFEKSVQVMKTLITSEGMKDSIGRAKERGEERNIALLESERENINEAVRKITDAGGSGEVLRGASPDLIDALVLRYLMNRDLFMKTFPGGIEEIDLDPVSVWAAMMISPRDEKP